MKFNVRVISDAEADLLDIYLYVALNDSPEKANRLIDSLEEVCLRLETMPERGHIPPELKRISIFDYRELHFKPYRIIYQIIDLDVFIHYVLDGRRDIQEILLHRLLR